MTDKLLVHLAATERRADAEKLYQRAQKLESAGQSRQALDLYRHAHNEQRKNIDYRIALIRVLQQEGLNGEAESEGSRLVSEQPAAGPVNLVMARLLKSDKRYDDAAWFYHRALYGNWSAKEAEERQQVRLELAEMLADRHESEKVVAEVLLLLNEAGNNIEIRRRSADLLLRAGSWQRAASLYGDLVRERPSDPALHAGLGLALFGDKNYRRARAELLIASRLDKTSEDIREKLQVAEAVVDLDPNSRRIGGIERARRRRELLGQVSDVAASCSGAEKSPQLDAAKKMLAKPVPTLSDSDEAMESAEELWNSIPANCKSGLKAQALAILMGESSH
jgi:predicted Zn-dependent protease